MADDYLSREDMDITLEDIHGNWWGLLKDGRTKHYYMKVWDRPDGWVRITAQRARELPSSVVESLNDPSDEMIAIHSERRGNPDDLYPPKEEAAGEPGVTFISVVDLPPGAWSVIRLWEDEGRAHVSRIEMMGSRRGATMRAKKVAAATGERFEPYKTRRNNPGTDSSAVKKGELPFYRGGVGPLTSGPAYFSSSETMAGFYGPVTEYRVKLRKPKFVDQTEWGRFDATMLRFDPSPIEELEEEGYDSVVWATDTPNAGRMFTVFALDGKKVSKRVRKRAANPGAPVSPSDLVRGLKF